MRIIKNDLELLRSKEWLYNIYWIEKNQLKTISKKYGFSPITIRKYLKIHDIKIRSKGEAKLLHRKSDGFSLINQPVLEGCLLGDGSLRLQRNRNFPYFEKKNKYLEHINYVANQLFFPNNGDRINQNKCLVGKEYRVYHRLTSLAYPELVPLYNEWYPEQNDYKKCVPKNLTLTPQTILHWFLDDGCARYCYGHGKMYTNRRRICFATMCFSEEDNIFLCDQLKKLFSINAYVERVKAGTGFSIDLRADAVNTFYDVIGTCPEPLKLCMSNKWKEII